MNVDEALRVADNPRNYTHMEQTESRDTLAAEVRRLQPIEERATELVEFDGRGVNPKSDAALYILGARRTP